ncbi:MAG: LysR substrate-binding domain-containing protein [Rhodobacter sp.]|nr:LysR substrate-binding domain-containing protein [Rhodobacter sp.]
MRHSQLRAFHHVAQTGGFSRAARAMHLSQPAVSDQVGQLERDHDVLLFHRTGRQVVLTEAGARLYALTQQYFELEDRIAQALSASQAAIKGRLRLVVDAAHHINDVLSRFRAKHPKVTIDVTVGNSAVVLDELRAYRADIGVIGTRADEADFVAIPLGASPIVAFAPIELAGSLPDPLPLAELTRRPFISREQGSKTRALLETEMTKRGLKLSPAVTAQGREAVRDIVAAGAGIGVISGAEFGADKRLQALPLADCELEMRETLICLSRRREVPVIQAFMEVAGRASKAADSRPNAVHDNGATGSARRQSPRQ